MAVRETFDVVVVGVSDALRGSEGVVAEDLAQICRLPAANIKLALNQGELFVHRRVGAAEAGRHAIKLRDLGAMVETRPSEESMELPTIEADPDALPDLSSPRFDLPTLALDGSRGGSRDPGAIAPPPDFGSGLRPTPAAPILPRGLAQSRERARPQPVVEREPRAVLDNTATSRFEPVPSRAPAPRVRARPPAATEIHDLDAPTSRYEPVPEERRRGGGRSTRGAKHEMPAPVRPAPAAAPPTAPEATELSALDSLVGHLEAVASGGPELGVVTLDGLTHAAGEAAEQPKSADPPAATEPSQKSANEPSVRSSASTSRASFGPADEPSLSLEAFGTMAAASGTGSTVAGSMAAANASSAASRFSGTYAASSGSFAGAAAFARAPDQSLPEPRNLFVSDAVANYLIGVTLGVVVGVVVALALRGSDRDAIDKLEVEIGEALIRPLAVESGEIRAPSVIRSALEDAYGDARRNFLLKMFLIGVPLGLGAGRIRLG